MTTPNTTEPMPDGDDIPDEGESSVEDNGDQPGGETDDIESLIADPAVYAVAMQECADDDGEPDEPNDKPADDEPEPVSREAQRYRLRLRETEDRLQSAADELAWTQDRLETLYRREVERLAATRLADAEDVWLSGAGVAATHAQKT